ncbi:MULTISPECIES: hypothetical protein [unclassified Corynebacterium]|uniref:hypothetical protein n=1 Tax=unclassified Corynebacterium TaxID=2624378 RepID=UPI0029CA352B|nr:MULTISPECIES: hypothetical protein [unclassified Corynebacterium]WPF66848.1 hypothetical protein OLX12_03750 [Corynebacterium sp. 22KM0430]WPF69336.1 hypothetical protein OLW90_03745 [Corynebacterium sp. 21KM1197]
MDSINLMNQPRTRDRLAELYADDLVALAALQYLWDILSEEEKGEVMHNGAYGDTWYGLDLGMWVAAQRKYHVPEKLLAVIEAEMLRRDDLIRIDESIARLRDLPAGAA